MKIKSILIKDFRGLKNVELPSLDKHVNLFVGINGAGKSSILDAIALVMSWYTARMLSAKGRGRDIPKDNISIFSENGCTIGIETVNNGYWKLYRTNKYHKGDKSDLSAMNQMISDLRMRLDVNPKLSLPVIAYYGVNRVVPNKYPRLPKGMNMPSQLDTYRKALEAGPLFSDFFNWFRLAEDYENERYKDDPAYRDHGLEAVRRCMESILPEYRDMKVSRRPLALTMKKNGVKLKLNQLSDGEKCYISLACDIARRLAVANPAADPLKGKGIILIDEVDLHLHPKWQQNVVSRLVATFPGCQFFITTHSPIVASDVAGKVFGIKDGTVMPQRTFGKLSSSILSSVFDVSMARSLHVQAIIDSAYDAIGRNDLDAYAKDLEELVGILGADDPEVTGLKVEKMRREKLGHR